VREYTYAYGAICPFDGDSCYLILPAMDGICMNIFLKELSERFADNFVLIVADGAPCHKDSVLNIPENMMLVKLPPQSPQLNPTENNWDDMREKFFQNLVFESMTAVEEQLITASNFYESNPQIIHSIASWNWIINAT
jgi:hypothetical protein